jgi:4-hydroxybenzoate polyprenyltransferase
MHVVTAQFRRYGELLYRMLRLRTVLLILLFVAVGDAATKQSPSTFQPRLIVVFFTLSAWYVFSTSVNDLADEAIDQVNLKGNLERPLANKRIGRAGLWRLALVACVVALTLSLLIGRQAIYLTTASLVLSYIYSQPPIQISRRGILAPLLLPIGYVVFPVLLTAKVNGATSIDSQFTLLTAGLYMSFAGRIILKDFRDLKGDARFGKRTFIVRYGAVKTCLVSATAWAIGFSLMVWRFRDWPLLIFLLIPFLLAIFYFLKKLASEKILDRQINLVGLIGRLGNSTALLTLTGLYYELEPLKTTPYTALLIGLAFFNVNAVYVLYAPLFQKSSQSR